MEGPPREHMDYDPMNLGAAPVPHAVRTGDRGLIERQPHSRKEVGEETLNKLPQLG